MKRRTIITSVLVIVLCLGLISGSTFALFTSEDSVNIAVTSGKVNVVATIDADSLKVYSATVTPNDSNAAEAGTLTGTFAGTYYYDSMGVINNVGIFANGGTATLTDEKTLKLDRITPGDKVTLTVSIENNSNVKTKYRIRVNVLDGETLKDAADSLKLFEGLVVKVGTDNETTRTATALNGVIRVSDWYTLDARTANSEDNLADVPVEIFLPLEAGNEYQDLKTEIQITVEAVQNNAATNSELETINAYLLTQEPKTMYDAITSLVSANILGLTTYADAFAKVESYLWNVDTNQFYAEENATDFAYKYFKVYDAMPATQTYSIYAESSWTATTVDTLTVGFDAGVTTGITSVTYNRSTAEYAQDVVIRTNSTDTAVIVNAPKDVVRHYGLAGSINVVAAANASYHEFGKVAFAEISKGRMTIEEGAQVTNLHINSIKENNVTTNKFDSIIISIAENVQKPTFRRDDVEIATTGTLVVAIQNGTEELTEETPLDYVWLTKQGIFEQIKVSDNSESMQNAKWADDDDFEDTNTQEAAIDIANNIGRDNNGNIKVEVEITKQDAYQQDETKTYKVVLDENRDLVVVDKTDTTEMPLATLDDKTSTVQVGTTEFTVALKSSQDNKEAELIVTNTADTTEVHKADAVSNSGLTEEEKENQKEDAVIDSINEQVLVENNNYVARIENQGFMSLDDAISAAKENDIIDLLANCSHEVTTNEHFSIRKGKFNATINSAQSTREKTWYKVINNNGNITVYDFSFGKAVAMIDTEYYYKLEHAIESAKENDIVLVIENLDYSQINTIIDVDKNITLDTNNFTISFNSVPLNIKSNVTLTITGGANIDENTFGYLKLSSGNVVVQGGNYISCDPIELDETLDDENSEYIAINYVKNQLNQIIVLPRANTKVIKHTGTEYVQKYDNYALTEVGNGNLYSIFSNLKNNDYSYVCILPGHYVEATTIYVYSSMDIMGLGDAEDIIVEKPSSSDSNRHLFNLSNRDTEGYDYMTLRNMKLIVSSNTSGSSKNNGAVQVIGWTKAKIYDLIIDKQVGASWEKQPIYVNGNNTGSDGQKHRAYMYVENCTIIQNSSNIFSTNGTYTIKQSGLKYNNGASSYTGYSNYVEYMNWDW